MTYTMKDERETIPYQQEGIRSMEPSEMNQSQPTEIEARINFFNRKKWSAYEYLAYLTVVSVFLIQFGSGVFLFASQNGFPIKTNTNETTTFWRSASCGDMGLESNPSIHFQGPSCVSKTLREEYLQCRVKLLGDPNHVDIKRNIDVQMQSSIDMFAVLERNIEVPLVLVGSTFIIMAIFSLFLLKCVLTTIWVCLVTTIAGFILFMIFSFDNFFPWPLLVYSVYSVILIALAVWKRKSISVAAQCISTAVRGLLARPHVVAVSFMSGCTTFAYGAWWVTSLLAGANNWKVRIFRDYDGSACRFDNTESSIFLARTLVFLLPLSYLFLINTISVICACGIGEWYFPDEKVQHAGLTGFLWAYTKSVPAMALSSFIMAALNMARQMVRPYMCLSSYLCTPCFLIGAAFSRFMLVAHTFHSGGPISTAKAASMVLKRRLGDALLQQAMTTTILVWGNQLVTLALAFLAWVWLDANEGGFLSIPGQFHPGSLCLLICCLGLTSRFPLIAIVLLGFLNLHGLFYDAFVPFAAAAFICAIIGLAINLMVAMIQSSTDTIFYCFALEAEYCNKKQERLQFVYDAVKGAIDLSDNNSNNTDDTKDMKDEKRNNEPMTLSGNGAPATMV